MAGEGGEVGLLLLLLEDFHSLFEVLMQQFDAVINVRVEETADFFFLCVNDSIRLLYLALELLVKQLALPFHDGVCILAQFELLRQSFFLLLADGLEVLDLFVELSHQHVLVLGCTTFLLAFLLEPRPAIGSVHFFCYFGLDLLLNLLLLPANPLLFLLVLELHLVALALLLLLNQLLLQIEDLLVLFLEFLLVLRDQALELCILLLVLAHVLVGPVHLDLLDLHVHSQMLELPLRVPQLLVQFQIGLLQPRVLPLKPLALLFHHVVLVHQRSLLLSQFVHRGLLDLLAGSLILQLFRELVDLALQLGFLLPCLDQGLLHLFQILVLLVVQVLEEAGLLAVLVLQGRHEVVHLGRDGLVRGGARGGLLGARVVGVWRKEMVSGQFVCDGFVEEEAAVGQLVVVDSN